MTFRFSNLAHFWDTFVSDASVPVFTAYFAVIAAGLAAVQCAFLCRRAAGDPVIEPLVLRSLLILPAASAYILMFANMNWIAANGYSFRYLWFPLMLVPAVCSAAVTHGNSGVGMAPVRGMPKSRTEEETHPLPWCRMPPSY